MAGRDLAFRAQEKEDEQRTALNKTCEEISQISSRAKEFHREKLSDKEKTLSELSRDIECQKNARKELETRVKNELGGLMPMNMMRDLGQIEAGRAHEAENVFIICQTTINSQTEALRNEEKNIETMGASLKRTEAELMTEKKELEKLEGEMMLWVQSLQGKLMESTQQLRGELEQKKADIQRRLFDLDQSIEERSRSLEARMDAKSLEINEVIAEMMNDARNAGRRV